MLNYYNCYSTEITTETTNTTTKNKETTEIATGSYETTKITTKSKLTRAEWIALTTRSAGQKTKYLDQPSEQLLHCD